MTQRQRKTRRRRRRGGKSKLVLALVVLALAGAVALISVTGYVLAVAATAPALHELKPIDKGATSVIYAADGSRLGYVRSDEIRTPVPWSDMPPSVRESTI